MRHAGLIFCLLGAALLRPAPAEAQPAPTCPPAFGLPPDSPWCETLIVGPDRMIGTADDQPSCADNLQQDCAQTSALVWSFDDGEPCSNCAAIFYVAVDCSPELHFVFPDMEAAQISVTDMSTGLPMTLVAENEAWRRAAANNPFVYCDGCGDPRVASLLTKDDAVLDKPAGSCNSPSLGTWPEIPSNRYRQVGRIVSWGHPWNPTNPDQDGSGVVESDEMLAPPCTPCGPPDCYCGSTTEANRVTEEQLIDVVACGEDLLSGVYRIEILSGGDTWQFMANSHGREEPEFLIYSNCDEALAAWTPTGGAQLALDPDPEVAVRVVDASACPAEVTIEVTTCNVGNAPADAAPFVVEPDDGTAPLAPFFGDNAAHPIDIDCIGPLAPGECRTCTWVVPLGGGDSVQALVRIDPENLVEECSDSARGTCDHARREQGVQLCGEGLSCSAVARGVPASAMICLGESVGIDATGSSLRNCDGVRRYRYESPVGTVLPGGDWSSRRGYEWTPTADGDQELFVRLQCSADAACEGLSDPVLVSVGPIEPLLLAGAVTAAPDADCALLVTWEAATGGDGPIVYGLHRSASPPVLLDGSERIAEGLGRTSFRDEGWQLGVSYRVVARDGCQETPNDGGDSAPASSIDLTPPDFAGVVDTRDLGFCEVEVSWDPASDDCSGVASFNVYRDHGIGNRGETLVASDVPGSPYIDTTPGNGTWVYVVRAVDVAGNEDPNDAFQQESENSCTNDFPEDAGMDDENGVDPPNGDSDDSGDSARPDGLREWRGRLTRGDTFDALTVNWNPSPSELATPHVITYSVLRGTLQALREGRFDHELASPDSCGVQDWTWNLTGQDGGSFYYLIAPVGGDNATFGYDSNGDERPEAPVCFER